MLAVDENLILVKVFQNIACYDMFLDLAANACKGDRTVAAGFALFSLLEGCSRFVSLPVFGDGPCVQALQEDNDQEWRKFCCKFLHNPGWEQLC